MAWTASAYDEVSIKTLDDTGQGKDSKIRVSAGASDGNVQTLIAKLQAQSNGSIQSYTRHKQFLDDAAPAAVPFDPATNPLNALSTALDLEFSCGPGKPTTSTSILAPSNNNLVLGSFDKLRLDPASGSYGDIESAAQAVMVNTAGTAVTTLETTQVETRKSRMLH